MKRPDKSASPYKLNPFINYLIDTDDFRRSGQKDQLSEYATKMRQFEANKIILLEIKPVKVRMF